MSAQRWVLALMVGAIGAIAFGATTTGCYETCDPGETRSCSCGTTAGLETCQPGEYWGFCECGGPGPGTSCGDAFCDSARESCSTCPGDCGACTSAFCGTGPGGLCPDGSSGCPANSACVDPGTGTGFQCICGSGYVATDCFGTPCGPTHPCNSLQAQCVPSMGAGGCSSVVSYPGCALDSTAGDAASIDLGVRYHAQHTQVWCWAAVSSSVTDYLRGAMGEDCDFLSAYFGYNCCLDPGPCNRPGLNMSEIKFALERVGFIYSRLTPGPLTECQLRQEIANGRPVIIGLTRFSGHVALVTGYDGMNYHIQDPYFGDFYATYPQMLSNMVGNWTQTLHMLAVAPLCM